MKLIGFNFTKTSVEKLSENLNNVKVNTNMDIKDISKTESDFLNKTEDLLKLDFTYAVNYDTDIAKIELAGRVFFSLDPQTSKKVLKEWKDKKVHEEIKLPLINVILRKSNVKALQLEDEMGLPLHIPLPTLKKEKKE